MGYDPYFESIKILSENDNIRVEESEGIRYILEDSNSPVQGSTMNNSSMQLLKKDILISEIYQNHLVISINILVIIKWLKLWILYQS